MTPPPAIQLHAATVAETGRVARAVAALLRPGDALLLEGGLASGKTCFTTLLARALGAEDAAASPTYGLARFHETRAGRLLHMDVYRLRGRAEFHDLGLEAYFPACITVIEWGGLVAPDFPEHLSVAFAFDPDAPGADDEEAGEESPRLLTLTAHGPRWRAAFPRLRQALEGEAA